MKTETNLDFSHLPSKPDGTPLAPRQTPGYYAGLNTLSQRSFWDDATRKVVNDRVESTPRRTFFSEPEYEFWTAVFDHLIPQADRTLDRRIDLVAPLDHRLKINQTVGYRYENMPPDHEAYGLGVEAINDEAKARFGADFQLLDYRSQDLVLKALHDGVPQAARKIWEAMSVHRFWQLVMGDAIDAYYSHPWAWDEIGFGGPAYPRAYTRLERGEPEPWEVEERRYEWRAPEAAVSHEAESAAHLHTEADQHKSVDES